MSDLTDFRDHCRKMAGPALAPGSPAAAQRALWLQLADEIDAYLEAPTLPRFSPDTAQGDLFASGPSERPRGTCPSCGATGVLLTTRGLLWAHAVGSARFVDKSAHGGRCAHSGMRPA